jgi:outer membrane lipoprotein-sorting protein
MRIVSRQLRIELPRAPRHAAGAPARDRSLGARLARALLCVALCAPATAAIAAEKDKSSEKPATASWYAETISHSDNGLNITHLWALKSRFRAETVIRGLELVTIVNGDTYYSYDATTMTVIAIRRAPAAIAEDSRNPRPFGNELAILIEDGGEKVREDNVGGRPADVYQVTDVNGKRSVSVTQDDRRLPIRIEVFDRKSGSTRYKEYIDWAAGLPLTDAFFTPDPRVQFQHFELDEYVAKALAKDPATAIPILYGELLNGPTPH